MMSLKIIEALERPCSRLRQNCLGFFFTVSREADERRWAKCLRQGCRRKVRLHDAKPGDAA